MTKGADANKLFSGNTTPLAMAAWNLHVNVIVYLLSITSEPFMQDCFGWNSFDWATTDPSVLSQLLKNRPEKFTPTSPAARES